MGEYLWEDFGVMISNETYWKELVSWWKELSSKYDYLCIHDGEMFPINDADTHSKHLFDEQKRIARESRLVRFLYI